MFVNLDHFPKDRVNIKYIWNHLVIILAIREFHDIFHQLDFFFGGGIWGMDSRTHTVDSEKNEMPYPPWNLMVGSW